MPWQKFAVIEGDRKTPFKASIFFIFKFHVVRNFDEPWWGDAILRPLALVSNRYFEIMSKFKFIAKTVTEFSKYTANSHAPFWLYDVLVGG